MTDKLLKLNGIVVSFHRWGVIIKSESPAGSVYVDTYTLAKIHKWVETLVAGEEPAGIIEEVVNAVTDLEERVSQLKHLITKKGG